jgi:gliding motility-associated-like protein
MNLFTQKSIFSFLLLLLLLVNSNSTIAQITIYEDLFSIGGTDGGANTTTAFISGTAPNNTNWRYTEFENSFGPSWNINNQEAVLQNTFGVNRSFGANMLFKGGNNYYTAPGGLYEQTTNFTTVFTNNTDIVEWTFNFRSPNETPQGLTNGGAGFTGGAFVLGLDSPTLRSCTYTTVGYAVTFGDASGSGNYVKLIRVNGGTTDNNCATNNQPHYTFFNWNGANTTSCIVSDNVNLTTSWYSVKVQYNPANDEWRLFVRNDGGTKGDPQTLNDTHCKGANVDAAYTSNNLAIMGIYACVPDDNALRSTRWDNIRIKVGVPLMGCPTTTSLCGAYSICSTPTINSQPSSQSICSSGSATLNISATPSTGPYQWQYFNGTTWSNVANGTPTGFTYSNATTASLGITTNNADCGAHQFRVLVGSAGCQATSNSATVTVLKATRLAPIGQQCSGTVLNFDACPAGATYSWSVTAPAGTAATPTNGAGQTFSFTPTNTTLASQTYTVNASITFGGLTCTQSFVPTVVPPAEAGTLNGTASVCIGGTSALTSNGMTGGTWTSSNNSIATVSASGVVTGVAVGSVTITYTVNATAPCTGSDLATLSITVTSGPEAGTLNGTASVCVGNTTTITSNGDTGGAWTSSNNSIATVSLSGVVTGVAVGSATITYTVNGAGSCTGSDFAILSITVTPGPEAGTLSGTASVCVGNTTTITSNGDIGGAWTSSNSSIATVSASGVVSGVAAGSVTITYTVNGSGSCPGSDLATLSITVIAAPEAGTLSGTATVCVGNTTTITSNGDTGGAWTSSNNSIATVSASGVVTGVVVGSATITYTVNGSGSCTASDIATLSITVTPGPEAGTLSGTASVCVGNTTTITSNGDTGGTWTSSNSSIATVSASGVVSGVAAGSVTITYTVNGSGSCPGTDFSTLTITVLSGPNAGVISGISTLCQGTTTTLSTSGDAGGVWSSSNTAVATVSLSGVITTIGSGTATITYTVSGSANGCTGANATASASTTVTITPIPLIVVNSPIICAGQSATLTAIPSSPGGSYNWVTTGQTTSFISVTPAVTTDYQIIYSINGCSSTPGIATVTVNQSTPISFTTDVATGCVPLTVTLTSSLNSGTCVWDLGNGQTLNGCTATYTLTQPGCYDISLISTNNGCTSSALEDDVVCVDSSPIAAFSSSVTSFDELVEEVNFFNLSTGAISYLWNFGNGQSSTAINPFYTFNEANNGAFVQLIAYSQNGCTDTAKLSIGYQEGEVFYVPNCFTPDGDEYNNMFFPIFYSGYDPNNFEMLIYDRWGELVFETRNVLKGWDGCYGINGRRAQDGTYIWKITFKNMLNDKRQQVLGHVNLIR